MKSCWVDYAEPGNLEGTNAGTVDRCVMLTIHVYEQVFILLSTLIVPCSEKAHTLD